MCLFVIHWSRLVSEHTLTPRSASCETSRSGQLQRRPALLAQLSFSRSELRVCLQALSVSAFERVPGDVYFLLPPSIRPSLLLFCRYSSPYAPLVAHDPHQLVTSSVFVSVLTLSRPQLSSQTATLRSSSSPTC